MALDDALADWFGTYAPDLKDKSQTWAERWTEQRAGYTNTLTFLGGPMNAGTISIKTNTERGRPVYIDPKTLKPCKHRYGPRVTEAASGWFIYPKCSKCDHEGSPGDKGVSLAKLVKQLGR